MLITGWTFVRQVGDRQAITYTIRRSEQAFRRSLAAN